MRVGIIRGDLPGPIFLADLEPTSQFNAPVDPKGQTRYVGRPDVTNVGVVMRANAFAGFSSTADIAVPVTIVLGVNDTLRAKTAAAAAFTAIVIPAGVYASLADLITAANPVLAPYGMALETNPSNGDRLVLYSLTGGAGSYIEIDTVANGSTFNGVTAAKFGAGGGSFTMPSVAAFITATLPVGGPLDVSSATILTQLGPALNPTQVTAVAGSIAPSFVDTDVAKKSFEVGNLAGYLSASYVPDPHRIPAMTPGAAITVVQDDGVTPFVAPVPNITGAVHNVPNAGDITITGVGLANSEQDNTVVDVTDLTTLQKVRLEQARIRTTVSGGTTGVVTATSIVIPASLLAGLGAAAGKIAQVQYTSLASNRFTTT